MALNHLKVIGKVNMRVKKILINVIALVTISDEKMYLDFRL